MVDLPIYTSHKKVRALEIATVNGHRVTFKEKGFEPKLFESTVFARYTPVPGDFYVVYEDGYESFSPRKAFVEGYTPEGQSFADIKEEIKRG